MPVGALNAAVGGPSVSVDAADLPVDAPKLPVDAPTNAAIVGSSISSSCCSTGCREESSSAPNAMASPGCLAVITDASA